MFKKVLESLSRTWKSATAAQPASGKKESLLDKIYPASSPAPAKGKPDPQSSVPAASGRSKAPEDLCAITPKMNKEEIRARLALLYRRYNRATSSLDTKLRAEAETMLDAIVMVREKAFGPI